MLLHLQLAIVWDPVSGRRGSPVFQLRKDQNDRLGVHGELLDSPFSWDLMVTGGFKPRKRWDFSGKKINIPQDEQTFGILWGLGVFHLGRELLKIWPAWSPVKETTALNEVQPCPACRWSASSCCISCGATNSDQNVDTWRPFRAWNRHSLGEVYLRHHKVHESPTPRLVRSKNCGRCHGGAVGMARNGLIWDSGARRRLRETRQMLKVLWTSRCFKLAVQMMLVLFSQLVQN